MGAGKELSRSGAINCGEIIGEADPIDHAGTVTVVRVHYRPRAGRGHRTAAMRAAGGIIDGRTVSFDPSRSVRGAAPSNSGLWWPV